MAGSPEAATVTMRRVVAAAVLTLLVACSGELGTVGEPLRVLNSGLADGFVGEPYVATIMVAGGLRPFTFAVAEGVPPPGVALQGGSLRGTPTELGSFSFTVTVSDANLSKTFTDYTLIVAEIPPPQLGLNPPPTEVQAVTTLRGVVDDARGLTALRTVVRWDIERFVLVDESVRSALPGAIVFWESREGELQIDLAFGSAPVSGRAEAFRFDLTLVEEPSTMQVTFETEFLSGTKHHFRQQTEGIPPETNPSEEGSGSTSE